MRAPSVRTQVYRQHVKSTSRRVPFKPYETSAQRHARRFAVAMRDCRRFGVWCQSVSIELAVSRDGELWRIKRNGKALADWYPRSARLLWYDGRKADHVHDINQLRELLA